jgi:transposase
VIILLQQEARQLRGPKPPAISLSEAEEQALEKLIKAHSTEQQIALRARVIIAASRGLNNTQIARELNVSVDMARHWRDRWLSLQPMPLTEFTIEDRLSDLPRSGKPSGITTDQMCQIVALACEKPEQTGRPISHWTGREIGDEIVKRGIMEQISPRHAARLLKRARSQAAPDPLLAHRGAR